MSDRVTVLLAAGGEQWEAAALGLLGDGSSHVLKRCVDLTDLLASATTGQVDVAVVAGELPGLDADAVMQLLRHDVRCVAVGGDADTLTRIGVVAVIDELELGCLQETVHSAGARELVVDPEPVECHGRQWLQRSDHRRARTGRSPWAYDARDRPRGRARPPRSNPPCSSTPIPTGEPWPSTSVSSTRSPDCSLPPGSSTRAPWTLTPLRAVDASLTDGFEVLTGLPRPDRWVEARPGVLDVVLDRACEVGDVVVDTGFSLEDDADLGRNLSRNQLTLDAVAAADQVVVVGSAEPTGLARLARTLVELRDATDAPVTVVVNRMRDSLGWSRRDIVGMVEGYIRAAGVHFLPEDRATTDRALVAGKAVLELGDSPLRRALAELARRGVRRPDRLRSRPSAGRARSLCRRPSPRASRAGR